MASYLILGAGKFGRLAVERLSQLNSKANIVVVDCSSEALQGVHSPSGARVTREQTEVTAFLHKNFTDLASWDWLIPMVPLHVAYASLRQGVLAAPEWETIAVPGEVANLVPVAVRGSQGELFLSHARHLCPDDCPEPEDFCPVSGEPRKQALYEVLAALSVPQFRLEVIASRQLAPGVGGYPPRQLIKLSNRVADCEENLLIATACRCHGVVHALKRRRGEA